MHYLKLEASGYIKPSWVRCMIYSFLAEDFLCPRFDDMADFYSIETQI
jgi:hypothetical protein